MGCVQSRLAVLVTTPNAAFRRQILTFIGGTGLTVLEAADEAQAQKIANDYCGELHVCLIEGTPESALAILHSTRKCHPFMTGLVMTAHPESINAGMTSFSALAFIEKPFAWRELGYRLAERVNTSLNARHQGLMHWSAELLHECGRTCAAASAGIAQSRVLLVANPFGLAGNRNRESERGTRLAA